MPALAGDFGSGDIVEVIFNIAATPNFTTKGLFDMKFELKGLLLFESKHRKVSAVSYLLCSCWYYHSFQNAHARHLSGPSQVSGGPHTTKKRMVATEEIQFSKLNHSLKDLHLSPDMNATDWFIALCNTEYYVNYMNDHPVIWIFVLYLFSLFF